MTQDADAGNSVTQQQFTARGRTHSDAAMRRKSSQRITAQEGSRILEKFIKQPSNAEEDAEGKCYYEINNNFNYSLESEVKLRSIVFTITGSDTVN